MSTPELPASLSNSGDLNVDRMQEARKLFGFALQTPAEQTYDDLGRPANGDLPLATSRYIGGAYSQRFNTESHAIDLLLYGVADTLRLISPMLEKHSHLPKEVALQIAAHSDTITTHAVAANQSQDTSAEVFYNHPGHTFDLSPNQDAIWVTGSEVDLRVTRGCPAVEYVEGDTLTESELRIEPIFRKFTIWAGELAVHSYFDHLHKG